MLAGRKGEITHDRSDHLGDRIDQFCIEPRGIDYEVEKGEIAHGRSVLLRQVQDKA